MAQKTKLAPVVEAKLYPGVGASSPLHRQRLDPPAEFLDGAVSVVLCQAPAGYGKSTLMARWHRSLQQDGIDCAWLSLDADDNDPARFIHYLAAALQRVDPDLAKDASIQATNEFARNTKPILESLAADLNKLKNRLVLFLDDTQFIHRPELLEMLDWLISYSPPQCQFVIGSREDPKFRIGRLRVRRLLLEIDVTQLQFTLDEAIEFMNARLGAPLAPAQVRRLLKRTEGWPAGMELAALALETETDWEALIETFAGDDRNVVDYLGEVVLENLDSRNRNFIYSIALFDRVCGQLVEQVTGEEKAASRLKRLHAKNLFLIPLDRHGEWYRLHHLVGSYLRDRAIDAIPEQSQQMLQRGAQWLFDNGYPNDAIGCAIRGQNWEDAARWIAETAEELVYRYGYHQTILDWMNSLPQEHVDEYPSIRLNFAFALTFYSRRNEVESHIRLLKEYRGRLAADPEANQQAINTLQCGIELQELILTALCDDGLKTRDLGQKWLEDWPQAPLRQRGVVANVLAFGYKSSGELEKGLEILDQAQKWFEQTETYYAQSWTEIVRTLLFLKRGDYLHARQSAHRSLDVIHEYLNGLRIHASLLHAFLAEIAYEFGEYDKMANHVDEGITSTDEYGQADFHILKYISQARLHFLRGDETGGIETLRDGQKVGRANSFDRVTTTLIAEECAWLCRLGHRDQAREVAKRVNIHVLPGSREVSGLTRDKAYRVASRIVMHETPERVTAALSKPIKHCQDKGYIHRQVELLLLKAAAHKHAGEAGDARDCIVDALNLGAERGYYQVYLDEAGELAALFKSKELAFKLSGQSRQLLDRIRQPLREKLSRRGRQLTTQLDGLLGQLTKRETQILKRLESGLSNREIAEAIFISEGTLKWHLHNIYGKLGVKNRAWALVRARELGLIAGN